MAQSLVHATLQNTMDDVGDEYSISSEHFGIHNFIDTSAHNQLQDEKGRNRKSAW